MTASKRCSRFPMLVAGAPRDLVTALACLGDDKVAEKAYEVIYKCHRG